MGDSDEGVESRITAGAISDLGLSNEVERVGFIDGLVESVICDDGKFTHDFEFWLDTGVCYSEIRLRETKNVGRLFGVNDLNLALKDAGFYIARYSMYSFIFEKYETKRDGKDIIYYDFGNGDLYKDKDLPFKERFRIPRIQLPKDFVPTRN